MNREQKLEAVREGLSILTDVLAEIIVDTHGEMFGHEGFERAEATAGQVAQYIGVSTQSVRNYIKNGLPARQGENGRYVVNLDDWEARLGSLKGSKGSSIPREYRNNGDC